jgi:hypothetical protein
VTLVGALAAWVLARSAGVAHELLKVKLWVQGGGSDHLRSLGRAPFWAAKLQAEPWCAF